MILRCSQCGADFEAPAGSRLARCPYCDTALVIDARGALLREIMLPTIRAEDAPRHLRRFMAGRETVAGLENDARLADAVLEYFPFWAFTIRNAAGEKIVLSPAAPSSLQGLQRLELPPGQSRAWEEGMGGGAPVLEAEIPVDTALGWLGVEEESIERVVLMHLPIYHIDYSFRGRSWHAAVDAVSGRVFPADFPAKAEAPFYGVAALALCVFGVEGFLFSNLLVKAGVYLVSAIPILALAYLVSRKV